MHLKKIGAETYMPISPGEVVVREYDKGEGQGGGGGAGAVVRGGSTGEAVALISWETLLLEFKTSYMSHIMLVAEYEDGREIVGVIRGCIKTVTSGKRRSNTQHPAYVKLAYILGLWVSSNHR
ncbi:hypothetical protein BUALT_Bualt07G0126900 [Buddleja alternifolia]|uniref:Uncharacterized protein n=1 Tax=Buddleja alternifolia TaxID=168488 RepID=A0AAV6XAA2_9LAMI|nr:hypothetical protein BUALT_Bualt07G0126900 [Buddleja alternifolia]